MRRKPVTRRKTTTYKDWAYIEGYCAARCQCLDVCICPSREHALRRHQEAVNRARWDGSSAAQQIARDEASYWLGFVHGKGTPTHYCQR